MIYIYDALIDYMALFTFLLTIKFFECIVKKFNKFFMSKTKNVLK